jgi:hypothetical protein
MTNYYLYMQAAVNFLLQKPEDKARYQQLMERIDQAKGIANKLATPLQTTTRSLSADSYAKKISKLREQADQLERRPKRRGPQLPLLPACAVRPGNLFDALEVMARDAERDAAEWTDVSASPDAIRWFAEQWEATQQRQQQEREREQLERERQRREQERVTREFNRILAGQSDPVGAALDVLNLPRSADQRQIKQRYHQLLKRLHPDTNANDQSANSLLRKVTDAMRVLENNGRV